MKIAGLPASGRLISLAAVFLLAACSTTSVKAPPETSAGPDRLVLTAVDFGQLPGWRNDIQAQALPAFKRSCDRITQMPAGQSVGAGGQGGLAGDWLGPCGALRSVNPNDPTAVRDYFETWFQPFLAANGQRSSGLFTGYFEAELRGSRHRGGRYQTPLYARPADLPTDSAQSYFSRAEIEGGALRGKVRELLWVDDPVDAHILHIQGSGRVILDDGSIVQVGYNGSNGRKFLGLGRILLDHGKIFPGDTTMQTVRAWLKSHPKEAGPLMAENPRYVFFRFLDADGPVGAAGVPLTAGRSLAVDPHFVPLGVPLWLDSVEPDGQPLRRLMVAQDSGAAIKGPVRGDVYWGPGEAAFDKAGRMKSQGCYYLLLPRERSGPVALAKEPDQPVL
ncbi:murein transglycosylase A [Telmatospirillum siberiense]|uniref:peptidoglycan lytic exotransglycosylase n=1 Tax=Telmatospirillum siberiense TaxID=382514 RepID=A0A2N3PMY8_9PROT|nr:MltA domain-containing protein [Telmatospirillum siberiense]PKU21761.1 murein transglycosylase [Telmatospirillum siberiense]